MSRSTRAVAIRWRNGSPFSTVRYSVYPIAWWIERELSALAEEACDTAVLESGTTHASIPNACSTWPVP